MGISGNVLNGKHSGAQRDSAPGDRPFPLSPDEVNLADGADPDWETASHCTIRRQIRQDGQTRIIISRQDTGEVRIFADTEWQAIAQWLGLPVEAGADPLEDAAGAIAPVPPVTEAEFSPSAGHGLDGGSPLEEHSSEDGHSHRATPAPIASTEQTETARSPRPLSLQIRRVQLSQALQAAVPLVFTAEQAQRSGAVMGQVPFAVQVGFSLAQQGAIAPKIPEDLSGQAQVYALNRATGDLLTLGKFDQLPLMPIRGGYWVSVPAVQFEELGIYHLKLLLQLQDCPTIPGYFEIPLLQAI